MTIFNIHEIHDVTECTVNLVLKKGNVSSFPWHSHSGIGNVYLLVMSKATG